MALRLEIAIIAVNVTTDLVSARIGLEARNGFLMFGNKKERKRRRDG